MLPNPLVLLEAVCRQTALWFPDLTPTTTSAFFLSSSLSLACHLPSVKATVFMLLPAPLSSKTLKKAVGKQQIYKVFMDLHGKILLLFLLRNVKTWTRHFCNAKGSVGYSEHEIMIFPSWFHDGTWDFYIAEMRRLPSHRELNKLHGNKTVRADREKWLTGSVVCKDCLGLSVKDRIHCELSLGILGRTVWTEKEAIKSSRGIWTLKHQMLMTGKFKAYQLWTNGKKSKGVK